MIGVLTFDHVFFLQRLQSCAFPDEGDTRDLQIARDSFESRWKNISRNVVQLLRQNQDRIALCKEFRDDYKQFMTWLRAFERQVVIPSGGCEDLHELSFEISRLQVRLFLFTLSHVSDATQPLAF